MVDTDEVPLNDSNDQHHDCHSVEDSQSKNDTSLACDMDMGLCHAFTMHAINIPIDFFPSNAQNDFLSYKVHELIAFNTHPARPPRPLL
ncbi:MAG: hypothetical protein ACI9SC_001503 [Gammaproteobacteria bacterium]|jgi:hypothetical protein